MQITNKVCSEPEELTVAQTVLEVQHQEGKLCNPLLLYHLSTWSKDSPAALEP